MYRVPPQDATSEGNLLSHGGRRLDRARVSPQLTSPLTGDRRPSEAPHSAVRCARVGDAGHISQTWVSGRRGQLQATSP